MDISQIHIPPSVYEERKRRYEDRIEYMLEYVENDLICRSRMLLYYSARKTSTTADSATRASGSATRKVLSTMRPISCASPSCNCLPKVRYLRRPLPKDSTSVAKMLPRSCNSCWTSSVSLPSTACCSYSPELPEKPPSANSFPPLRKPTYDASLRIGCRNLTINFYLHPICTIFVSRKKLPLLLQQSSEGIQLQVPQTKVPEQEGVFKHCNT